MARTKRANGAGTVYIKNGSYYGRWVTLEGGRTNRKLGRVRQPGTRDGLTRTQAEKHLRELIQTVQVTSDRSARWLWPVTRCSRDWRPLVDLPAVPQSSEVRYLTQEELTAVRRGCAVCMGCLSKTGWMRVGRAGPDGPRPAVER